MRGTRHVDVLVRPDDWSAARGVLIDAGFVSCPERTGHIFREGPDGKLPEHLRVVLTGEPIGADALARQPDVGASMVVGGYRTVMLEPLVEALLAEFRTEHRVHVDDLADVGLVDGSWPARFNEPLRSRLQSILDTPDG